MRHIENPMVLGSNPFDLEGPEFHYTYLTDYSVALEIREILLTAEDENGNEHYIELEESDLIELGCKVDWDNFDLKTFAKKLFRKHYKGTEIEND